MTETFLSGFKANVGLNSCSELPSTLNFLLKRSFIWSRLHFLNRCSSGTRAFVHLCHMTAVVPWGPCGVVAAAGASEHTGSGTEMLALKGICAPWALVIVSDWLLHLATVVLRNLTNFATESGSCLAPIKGVENMQLFHGQLHCSFKRRSAIVCTRTSSTFVVERTYFSPFVHQVYS